MSTGARPKTSTRNRQGAYLPPELLNDFYVDVVVIHSKTDEKLANTFISNVKSNFQTEDAYIIVSYLDRRLWSNGAEEFSIDYKRCSTAVYLFTKTSTGEYHTLTKDPYLQKLMYKEKVIPVLTLPKEELDLPMVARVPGALLYYGKKVDECPRAMLAFLKNNIEIRRMKERHHEDNKKRYLRECSQDCSRDVKENPPCININADNVIVGNNGNIFHTGNIKRNKKSKHKTDSTKFHKNPWKDNSIHSDDYQDEPGKARQNSIEIIQTHASMSSSSDENFASNSSFSKDPQKGSGKRIINHGSYETPRRSCSEIILNIPPSNPIPKAISGDYFTWNSDASAFSDKDNATTTDELSYENIKPDAPNNLPRPQEIPCNISSFSELSSSMSPYPSMDAPVTNALSTNLNTNWSQRSGSTNGNSGQSKKDILNVSQRNVDRSTENATPWSSHRYLERVAREKGKESQRNGDRPKENETPWSSHRYFEQEAREKGNEICDPGDSLSSIEKQLENSLGINSLLD